MKRVSFKIIFYLKKNKENAQSRVPIYMRVTVCGQRAEISLQRWILEEDWDPTRNRSKSRSPEAIQLNDYLTQCQGRVYEVQKQLEHDGIEVTASSIKARYHGDDPDKKYLLEEFCWFIDKKAELVGKELTGATVQKYRICHSHLQEFLRKELRRKDILLNGFTYEMVTGFHHFLLTLQNQQHNTAVKTMRTLKGFIRYAEDYEWIKRNPESNSPSHYLNPP